MDQRKIKVEIGEWIGITCNIALVLMKGIIGFMANSKALIADAAHSASDVAASITALIGLRTAHSSVEGDRPHGHAGSLASIIISVLLLIVGVEIAIASAKSIVFKVDVAPAPYALIVIILSITIKEALFQYKYRSGRKLANQAWIANAWKHRSGVYSSLVALVGVGGAVLGDLWSIKWLYYLDPLAGILVALLVLRAGYRLISESIHRTVDNVLHTEEAERLVKLVQQVKGVITVDEIRTRKHGYYVTIEMKISVSPRIPVIEGHDIAKTVKSLLMNHFAHVSDVMIHVNPYDPGYPYKNNVDLGLDDLPTLLH